MAGRVPKDDLAARLAARMESDEATAVAWIDAFTETLYDAFREGKSVTLPGFGGFYVRPGSTAPAKASIPGPSSTSSRRLGVSAVALGGVCTEAGNG